MRFTCPSSRRRIGGRRMSGSRRWPPGRSAGSAVRRRGNGSIVFSPKAPAFSGRKSSRRWKHRPRGKDPFEDGGRARPWKFMMGERIGPDRAARKTPGMPSVGRNGPSTDRRCRGCQRLKRMAGHVYREMTFGNGAATMPAYSLGSEKRASNSRSPSSYLVDILYGNFRKSLIIVLL